MRWAPLAVLVVSLSGSQPAPRPVPVVVELFTSEGCSSCPPADSLLSTLAQGQPVPGVEIIPLGMHVTYWDQLGWKDPASLAAATERQHGYGRVFGEDRIYTPQAVIDGAAEVVGSDESGLKRAIAKAAKQMHARLEMKAAVDGSGLSADVSVADLPAGVSEPLEVKMAVTESGLASIVKRGENGGHTLHHDAVVRLIVVGDLGASRVLPLRAQLRPEWRRDQLRAVAFVQGKKTQRIYGAASMPLK